MNYPGEEERALFYKIHHRLLIFTNQTAKLGLPFKTLEDFATLANNELRKVCQIRDHLFTLVKLWGLAKKNKGNMRCYNIALGKFYARSIKKSMTSQGMTNLHVSMFRDCVVAVAKTPKELEKLCQQNVPDKVVELYSFKV